MSSLTFKDGETVKIEIEVEELDSSIASTSIEIDDSDGVAVIVSTSMTDIGNSQFKYYWVAASDNPDTWVTATSYTAADIVEPVTSNTFKYTAQNSGTSGDTEPTWPTTAGNSVTDKYDIWVAETAYSLTDKITPVTANNYQYECTDAGTSGTVEPTWNTTPAGTTLDGPGIWTLSTAFIVGDIRTEVAAGGTKQYIVTTAGTSGQTEPSWDTVIGNTTSDFADNWVASTVYANDYIVTPVTPNGYQYKVTSGGTSSLSEPSWSTVLAATTVDTHTAWAYTTAYTLGNIVIPLVDNDYSYIVTDAGTSGVYEPDWPETIGDTVIDKPAIWEALNSYILNDRVTAVTPDGVTQYKVTNAGPSGDTEPSWDTGIGNTTTDEPSDWAGSTAVTLGEIRIPGTPNGYRYVVTNPGNTGNVEPVWSTVVGGTTWDRYGIWLANTGYVIGNTRTAVTPDGVRQYRALTNGTSSPTEPTWNVTLGENTIDNTVTWVTENEDRVQWTTETADSVIWTAEAYSEVEWTCQTGSSVEFITETLSTVVWTAEAYNGIVWTTETYTGIVWLTASLVTLDGIYDVTINVTDADGYIGKEEFKIRITE